MTDPSTDPVGTVRREDHEGGYSIWIRVGRSMFEGYGSNAVVFVKPAWRCVYSTVNGNSGATFAEIPDFPVIGAVPGTPAATDAPSRCPSCEHAAEFHHDEDGCWYTVTTGLPDAPLVCPCAVIPAALRPTIEEADVVHGAGRPMSAPDREALEQIIADEIAEWSIIGERGPLARPIADRLISAGLVRTPEPADTAGQP